MQKRYIPISATVICLALLALISYIMPDKPDAIPTRILFDNAGGKVVFDHKVHAEKYKIECQSCHHESSEPRENVKSCGTCHGVVIDSSFKKNHVEEIADFPSCVTCHHVEFSSKDWGHETHVEEYGLDCTDCHHLDTNIESEPQNCATCHEQIQKPSTLANSDKFIPSLRSAAHEKCIACHEDMFEAKVKGCASCHTKVEMRTVLKDQGTVTISPLYTDCTSCHVDEARDDLILGRMAAFHGSCIVCHEKLGKGPYTKDQCNQCHTL